MPNTRSAAKRTRADAKRRQWNLRVKSELKTLTKRFLGAAQGGPADPTRTLYPLLAARLDQAAQQGIIHRKTASRKKSRLAKRLSR